MAADLTMVNLALSRFGQAKITQIQLSADVHPSAVAANTFYDTDRDEVLGDSDWPFATVTLGLSCLGEDQTGEWSYLYSKPTLALSAIFNVFNSATTDTKTEQEFEVRHIPSLGVSVVYSNLDEAIGEFTYPVYTTSLWSRKFITAFSYRLAVDLCMAITGDDKKALSLMNFYTNLIDDAKRLGHSEKKKVTEDSSRYKDAR